MSADATRARKPAPPWPTSALALTLSIAPWSSSSSSASRYMDAAARIKADRDKVHDSARIEDVVAKVKAAAREAGLVRSHRRAGLAALDRPLDRL